MDQNHLAGKNDRRPGFPHGDDNVTNKYGTYEVQRTNGMENEFPMIAQGLSRSQAEAMLADAERWRRGEK